MLYKDSTGFVSNYIDAVDSESYITITASDVLNNLKETKLGKSAGTDGLATKHFIHSRASIIVHLSLLLSCMLSHGFLPDAFMRTSSRCEFQFIEIILYRFCTKTF